jgi:hypothetical protein
MTLEATVLRDDAVRRTRDGYEVDLHLAWYRSLPLSCVESVDISIAGKTVAPEELRVLFDGGELRLSELADRVDDWWFVQDPLTVRVPASVPVASGRTVPVSVHVAVRIPYIIIGPDRALVQHTRVASEVTVQ